MHDSQQVEPATSGADDQPAGIPDWLVEAYPGSNTGTPDPEWYDPAQLDLAEALGHKWWQDEQAILEPVIQPLPDVHHSHPASEVESGSDDEHVDPDTHDSTSGEAPSDFSSSHVEEPDLPEDETSLDAAGGTPGPELPEPPTATDTALLGTATTAAGPDTDEPSSEVQQSGKRSLFGGLKGRSAARKPESPADLDASADEEPQLSTVSAVSSSKWAALRAKARNRRKPDPADGEDSRPGGAQAEEEKTSRPALKVSWPAALTLVEGPKDDPYRPRFAVAPSSARAACVLLWVLAGANIVAAALFVTLALSSPGSLSLPTIGTLPVALMWLGVLFFAVTAVAGILAGQGVARGYRTWFLVGVTVSVCTAWLPLLALPALLLLMSRNTRDWVI